MNRVNENIQGPVIPLPVPFTKSEEVDYEALAKYTSFLVESGVQTLMTTVGTSRFNLLTMEEAMRVNETVVEAVAGRANTIVANVPFGGTRHAVAFGEHAESIGADYYLVYFPERDYGDEFTIPFFEAIHEATHVNILIHEMPRRNGLGGGSRQYSIDLLTRLFQMARIVGMKEEALDADYSNKLVETFSNNTIIIGAGGGMSRYFYRDYQRGAKAFLGGLGNFAPEIELNFYQSLTNGDTESARIIVEDIELKYFESVVPLGWHPHLKYVLSYKGLLPEWERSPMKMLSTQEKQIIHKTLEALNL